MIPLGAFELQSRLGHGGMGEVWRGYHRTQNVPVAVKLLTNALARKATFRTAFRNEVRAVAGLDHPNIVLVFDYGTVTEEAQRASEGALRAGTPWLAMELAEDGSLDNPQHVRSWSQLRWVVVSLLDALAHAHARGVVHRDIKPGNVLVASGRTLKLTDFGLAHAMDREDSDFVAGTPSYMAPEQFEGRWRDYGPWTDLYAVGCLVYALATGLPPYGILSDWQGGYDRHMDLPAPPLKADFPVPLELEAWVHRMIAKDPADRFRRCADAAWALLGLSDTMVAPAKGSVGRAGPLERTLAVPPTVPTPPPGVGHTLRPARDGEDPTPAPLFTLALNVAGLDTPSTARTQLPTPDVPLSSPATAQHTAMRAPPVRSTAGSASGAASTGRGSMLPESVRLAQRDRPPLPGSWRRPDPPARSPRLIGAGLGLFGLRTVPLVGRRAERDVLWDALQRASRSRRAELVVLQGPPGCGKSRLAEWLCERAHEVGGAEVMTTSSPDARSEPGVSAMFLRHLRAVGLDREALVERVRDWLDALGEHDSRLRDAIVEQLITTPGDERARTAGSVRRAVLVELIRRACTVRPLVVWLDEAHRDLDALDLARAVLEQGADLPVLLIATVRDDAASTRQTVAARLRALHDRDDARFVGLGPLAEEHRSELVRQLLGMEGPLAVEVERRTGGNPAFAVQLVGDWVQRGILEPGRRGFRLKDGALPHMPNDLRQVWSERLDRLLESRPDADAQALEVAALLGLDVTWAEWVDACHRAGVRHSGDLVEVLLSRRLARCGPEGPEQGFSLAHGLLREILEERARAAGRLQVLHAHCAEMLQPHDGRGVCERLARHRVEAGQLEAAIGPLLAAIDERLVSGEHAVANTLLADRERCLDAVGAGWDDVRVAEGWTRWARLAVRIGRYVDGEAWARRAADAARQHRWGRVLVDSQLVLGHVARVRGDVAESWRLLFEAEQLAQGDPTRWRLGLVRLEVGRLRVMRGQLDRGAEVLRDAREDLTAAQDAGTIGDVFVELAVLALQRGRTGAARVLLDWAEGRFTWLGCRLGLARTQLAGARLHRHRGELDLASDLACDALDTLRALGAAEAHEAELELALQAHDRGELDDARSRAERLVQLWSVDELKPLAARGHALLLCVAARTDDTRGVERHQARLTALLKASGCVDIDIHKLLRRTLLCVLETGSLERAAALDDLLDLQTVADEEGERQAG